MVTRSSITIGFLIVASLAVIALVLYTLGFNGLALWNAAPVVLALIVGVRALGRGTVASRAFAIALAITLLAAVAWGHLSWHLFPPTGPGSSTAAIAFVFWPIYSTLAGLLVSFNVWIIAWIVKRRTI